MFGERLLNLKDLCGATGFRVADLLMKKSSDDKATPSTTDTFCSGRDEDFVALRTRMSVLLEMLRTNYYKVYRYKIEQVVLDSKIKDELNLLGDK